MMAWGSHVTGAIQIALQRSIKSRKTDVGRNLFIAVRTQMIVLALASGKWFGNDVDWWMQDSVGDETAAQCQRICIRTAELRSEVNRLMALERNANTIEMMYDLIRRAQLIDQDCIRWTNNVPEYWKHWTAKWVDNVPGGDYAKAEVFPGPVHLYTDFWIASVWNMLRASRLALASVIVRCAAWTRAPANYRTTPEYATASRVAVETINDIISSVPYHLGWHLGRKDLIIQRQNLSGFACGSEGSPKGLAGYFISWPLTLVYGQDYTTDAQRRWVLGRFRHIADVLGIQYTRILSAVGHHRSMSRQA